MFGLNRKQPARISLLDGPRCPNDMLEQAVALPIDAPDDICVAPDGSLLVSSGKRVLRLRDWQSDSLTVISEFNHEVTALACRADGVIAVGLNGGGIRLITQEGDAAPGWEGQENGVQEATACTFASDGTLLVADAGGIDDQASRLHDLYSETGNGQLIRMTETGDRSVIASGLRLPYGVIETAAKEVLVCESWSARISQLSSDAPPKAVLQDAPGYPARIHALSGGGYILSLFARRDPLIEFVLSEPAFMNRMKAEIDPAHWIAPRFAARADYRVPIQMGAARLFGDIKPWAPSFSYGLVVILDKNFLPLASAQSRANGTRHGITAALEWRGELIAISKGSNELLKVTAMDQLI